MRAVEASYYRARYYDPTTARFLSEDPIGFDGGGNFYPYGQNSPIDESDPDGLTGKDKWYGYNESQEEGLRVQSKDELRVPDG